ncbi:MAG TPA: hypothetical protein PLR83_07510, partial [Pyrinomonadaceae bacterium]|nr:hypothetical protein [Pyrinomonadaceae bacterium]
RDIQLGRLTLYQLSYSRPYRLGILDFRSWICVSFTANRKTKFLAFIPKSKIRDPKSKWCMG